MAPVWNNLAATIKITTVVTVMLPNPMTALAIDSVPKAFSVINSTGAVNGKYINTITISVVGSDITVLKKKNGVTNNMIGTDIKELASLAVGVAAPIATMMPLYIRIDTINSNAAMVMRTGSKVIIDRSRLGRSI